MRISKSILTMAAVLTLGLAMTVPAAKAGTSDQLTKFEFAFTNPVEVPGKVLPAGTYWFVIHDGQNAFSAQEQNIIDIRNADNTRTIAIVPSRPVQRIDEGYGTAQSTPSMNGVLLTIADGTGKQPEALLDWFYPYGYTGHQFVYSDKEQQRLDEEPSQKIVLKAEKGSDGSYSASLDQ